MEHRDPSKQTFYYDSLKGEQDEDIAMVDAVEDLPKGICQNFVPQQWRKTKCKLCFQDIMEHTKPISAEESQVFLKNFLNEEHTECNPENNNDPIHNLSARKHDSTRQMLASTSTIVGESDFNTKSSFLHGGNSSKRSSERFDDADYADDSSLPMLNPTPKDTDYDTADESQSQTPVTRRRKKLSPTYTFDLQDGDDGTITPNRTSKRRARSYRKNSSNLLQLSAMVRSSNSSLCSFNSELTDGFSDYDFDLRSITDDTDDYAEVPDVIEELEHIKPELKLRVENERRVSRSKINYLERELEGQQDHYRASEVAKDRQIKSLLRDIEGLKLELSSVKAHENILALKSRLELEGKQGRITDLEQQVRLLQEELVELSKAPHTIEVQHDFLNKELERAMKRISQLEEENRSTEERMKLAEDLKHNDKELIDLLRGQCNSLENDLNGEQNRNSVLEEKLKHMELIRADLLKEQEKSLKASKEVEAMRQKIKRRDRHIEDLEDDNVKLEQSKRDLESQKNKKDLKMKKAEKKIQELQDQVTSCNKEIADLTGENKTLVQVRRLTDLQLKDMKTADTSEVTNGEQLFIHTLEDRLKHRESRLKELELENDNLLKEIKDLYDSILMVEKQSEDYKEQVKDIETKMNKMCQDSKHNERKIELLHKKLQKNEKEKRRAITKQNNAEMKLSQFQEQVFIRSASEVETLGTQGDSSDESDSRRLKLKLQSTEARLSMIEVNKGYLETKVLALERKLVDKEQELTRLNDSIERDSGAPSQDYDRFDALEQENIMLQTKVDELALENTEQKEVVNRLKENNNNLEKTIQNLNSKLETCTVRLKEVEEANHILGREAIKRNKSLTNAQDVNENSMNELREHNKMLKEKLQHYDGIEELVEGLEQQLTTKKSHVQWYFDENEKLKIQTAKMADTIRSLEHVKFEFEQSVHDLSEKNKDLNNDVKRLEQKLEIYGEMFDKDSNFHSSLKRRSYQGDRQEQDDERLLTNALAPLMEEIKEKDLQIRSLQKAVDEKEKTINSLNKEIDLLETMITEKIRSMTVAGNFYNIDTDIHDLRHPSDIPTVTSGKVRSQSAGDVYSRMNTTNDLSSVKIGCPYTLVLPAHEIEEGGNVDGGRSDSITDQKNTDQPSTPPRETFLALTSMPSPTRRKHSKDNTNSDVLSANAPTPHSPIRKDNSKDNINTFFEDAISSPTSRLTSSPARNKNSNDRQNIQNIPSSSIATTSKAQAVVSLSTDNIPPPKLSVVKHNATIVNDSVDTNICSSKGQQIYNARKFSVEYNTSSRNSTASISSTISTVEKGTQRSSTHSSPQQSPTSLKSVHSAHADSQTIGPDSPVRSSDDSLSVSMETFYQILQDHEENLKAKDAEYLKSIYTEGENPSIYQTIESAILDQYREDDEGAYSISSNIPSLHDLNVLRVGENISLSIVEDKIFPDKTDKTDTVNHPSDRTGGNKALNEDMYDQLAQLEDLVNRKYPKKSSLQETVNRNDRNSSWETSAKETVETSTAKTQQPTRITRSNSSPLRQISDKTTIETQQKPTTNINEKTTRKNSLISRLDTKPACIISTQHIKNTRRKSIENQSSCRQNSPINVDAALNEINSTSKTNDTKALTPASDNEIQNSSSSQEKCENQIRETGLKSKTIPPVPNSTVKSLAIKMSSCPVLGTHKSTHFNPSQINTSTSATRLSEIKNRLISTKLNAGQSAKTTAARTTENYNKPVHRTTDIHPTKTIASTARLSEVQYSRESNLGVSSNTTLLCRTPSTSSTHSQDSNGIDLSGLDDLLAEVGRRESGSQEKYAPAPQERRISPLQSTSTSETTQQATTSESRPTTTKVAMPSIRTTKRRIIKLGGLNRSGSFDSATKRKTYVASAASIASRSSTSLLHNTKQPISEDSETVGYHGHVIESPGTGSLTSSTSSVASVVYVPTRSHSISESNSSERQSLLKTGPPFRRPTLEGSKYLSGKQSDKTEK